MCNGYFQLRAMIMALFFWLATASPALALPNASVGVDTAPVVESRMDVPAAPAEWNTVSGPYIRVHGHPDEYRTLLRLSQHASDTLPELASTLNVPIGDTIHIFVTNSDAQFRKMQPGNAPQWADAVAYPALGVIYLRAPKVRGGQAKPLTQVLDHELVHIVLGRAFYPQPTPHWLQEGVAQVMAHEYTPDTAKELASGMWGGGLLSLDEVTGAFPADPSRARLAYAQSADFVAFLQRNHGDRALDVLIHELAALGSIEMAIRRATGQTLAEVDAEWRQGLQTGFPLAFTVITNPDVWFGFTGLALLVGGVMRRRQFRRRMVEMEAQEKLVDDLLEQFRAESAQAESPGWVRSGY